VILLREGIVALDHASKGALTSQKEATEVIDRRMILAAAGSAAALAAVPARAAPSPTYFVLFYSPGPRWKPGVGFRDQPGIGGHGAYLDTLQARGLVVMGGPFLDNSGGMLILSTATADEARGLGEADPAVKAGLMRVTVRPWLAAFAR
jgi:uncharacterized protein